MAEVPHDNFKKPKGFQGMEILSEMNESHRDLHIWALSKIETGRPEKILDVGCGGGAFIRLLSEKYPDSKICGIDYSYESVKMSKDVNRHLIESKKCEISEASVSSIPYGDGEFDLVTAVETYFFWPDLEENTKELYRVVSEGGTAAIVAESYPDPRFDEQNEKYERLYGVKLRKNEEMEYLLESAGFSVETETVPEKNWVIFVGRKN